MAITTIVATNLIAEIVTLYDLGFEIAVAGSRTLKSAAESEVYLERVVHDLELLARVQDDSVSLTVNATLLTKAEALAFLAYPTEILEYIPLPEAAAIGIGATVLTAPAVLQGGSFILPRPVLLNRVAFRTVAFSAPATGVILIYQDFRGLVINPLRLVATVQFTAVANTTFEVAPNEGSVSLSDGCFYALWGQDSGAGSFSMQTYNTGGALLINNPSPTGTHPVNASSAIAPVVPAAATLNPMIGGDLLGANTTDCVPLLRFRNV